MPQLRLEEEGASTSPPPGAGPWQFGPLFVYLRNSATSIPEPSNSRNPRPQNRTAAGSRKSQKMARSALLGSDEFVAPGELGCGLVMSMGQIAVAVRG